MLLPKNCKMHFEWGQSKNPEVSAGLSRGQPVCQRSGRPVPVNFVRLETLLISEAEEFRQSSAHQCDPLKEPLLAAGSPLVRTC